MRKDFSFDENMIQVQYEHLGTKAYGESWDYQESLMKKALDIKAARHKDPQSSLAQQAIEHYLLLVRHPHVYTLGKSGDYAHLLLSEQKLKEINAVFFPTNRGGDITYHGPGQMVAYPILDLEQFFTDLGRYMRTLEEIIIQTIGAFGIQGERLEGSTGVWLDVSNPSKARKICAMGVKCSRWVTLHGLALNINTDLSYFGHIVPCGIVDKGVTSMQKELGYEVDEAAVEKVFLEKFAAAFQVELIS